MCVRWIARESSPPFCFGWASAMAWHLRYEFGVKTIRYQAIPCAWSATSSLFAYTHSSLKPSLCFGFQGYIRYGFRLFVFVYALHSVVKPTHASVFITTLRFIQTIASLKGFDRTIRSITLLVFTPRVLHARQAFRIALVKSHKGIEMGYCSR